MWGSSGAGFFSGPGSNEDTIVRPYVEAVREFVATLGHSVNAVGIGCGDFNVGRQIFDVFSNYSACDIVAKLIDENRKRYVDLPVNFEVMDITVDPLPQGDIVLVRQVLQHLSNADIAAALPKIAASKYAIITEHLPATPSFKPNLNQASVRILGFTLAAESFLPSRLSRLIVYLNRFCARCLPLVE